MTKYFKEKIQQLAFILVIILFMLLSHNIEHKIIFLFFATILNIILKIFHLGAMTIISIAIGTFLGLFSIETALASFSQTMIWQISIFLFLAQALIQSGLSRRIALKTLYWFGTSTLILSYGICLLVTLFAIIMPTSTARIGGIIIPIINDIFDIIEQKNSKLRLNIIFSVLYANTIASAMFLSASAGNFYIQQILLSMKLNITGNQWLINSIVPGVICLITLPLLLQYLTTKENTKIPNLKQALKKEIEKLGPINIKEIIMMITFFIMFGTWIFGEMLNINFISVLFVLTSILLVADLLDCQNDIIRNEDVWQTFFWLSNILMLSELVNQHNAFEFIVTFIYRYLNNIPKNAIFVILLTFYGYSQYLFASSTVHISSFFEIVLNLMLAYKFPSMLSILALSYTSNLFAGLTNYSSSEVILLSNNYGLNTKKFIKTGFVITSCIYCTFMITGLIWWKILGAY